VVGFPHCCSSGLIPGDRGLHGEKTAKAMKKYKFKARIEAGDGSLSAERLLEAGPLWPEAVSFARAEQKGELE